MVTLFKSRHIPSARFLPDAVRTFAPINMRISLLFLSCLHVVAASAQPGADAPNVTDAKGLKQGEWSRTWHDSQQVRYTGRFVDDVPVGTFTYYSTTGKLESVIDHYPRGSASHARHYHPNGKLMAEGRYEGQRKDSTWTYYDTQGNRRSVERYANGTKDGEQVVYYADGKVAERMHFMAGLQHGRFEQYHDNGVLQSESIYMSGQPEGVMTWYYPSGKKEIEGHMVNGSRDGAWLYFNEDGTIQIQVLYAQGEYVKDKKENGVFKEYFEDERPKSETTYRKGLKEGRHVEYHDNGEWVTQPSKADAPQGMPTGEQELVLKGQTVKLECQYKADRLVGELKEYDERGVLIRQEEYSDGELVRKIK